jgi:hypothetical protein
MADGKDHYSDWALASVYFLFYLFPTSQSLQQPTRQNWPERKRKYQKQNQCYPIDTSRLYKYLYRK